MVPRISQFGRTREGEEEVLREAFLSSAAAVAGEPTWREVPAMAARSLPESPDKMRKQ